MTILFSWEYYDILIENDYLKDNKLKKSYFN